MANKPKIIPSFVTGDKEHPWLGLNTAVKDNRYLDRGESYAQLNWITGRDKDHIELRRGSIILGSTKRNVAGAKVTGIGIGIKNDGTEVPFFTYAQKALYYSSSTNDTIEIGTDIMPLAASGENTNLIPYQNLAGSYIYLTSKNSSIYKISLANLGSYLDLGSKSLGSFTITIATPAVFILNNHGLVAGDTVRFTTTGTLPTGLSLNTTYYVIAGGLTSNNFEVAATAGGTAINTSGSQSGTHTLYKTTDVLDFHFGFAKINRGYMFGMNRKGSTPNSMDTTGVWLSTPDSIASNSSATGFSVGSGDGATKTFSGTISFLFPNTIYFVNITDQTELFTDDKNGNLIGSLGGTGTINYITGAYSVTFNTAPVTGAVINGTYYKENSTVNGVADFTGTGSDTFRQDDGGGTAQSIWPFQGVEYCFHQLRSWLFQIDTSASPITFNNQPYYEQIGIPNIRGAFPTGDGILFLNNALPAQPKISILQIPPGSTNLTVVPVSLSDVLDLSSYGITDVVIFRWGDYDIVSLKNVTNGQINSFNGVTFIRNIVSGLWNQLDFYINCGADFNGTLLGGSSLSPNVFELFSGFDDSNTAIANFHRQAFTNFNIEGLKKVGYLNMSGLIQKGQNLDVFISLDNRDYVNMFTIAGDGPYVSSQSLVTVGSQGIGINTVGGGFDENPQYASRYEVDIPIHTGLFEYISWGIQATGVGFVSVERQEWKDIRFKRRRLLSFEDSEIDN